MTNKFPIGYECKNCGKVHYPKHGRCLDCKSKDFREINLPSEGTLITYTILNAPPTGIEKLSLYLGIIDLGIVRYTGQLDVDSKDLQIGMRLRAELQKVREIDKKPIFGFVWSKK